MEAKNILTANNISKRYGGVFALNDVSFLSAAEKFSVYAGKMERAKARW